MIEFFTNNLTNIGVVSVIIWQIISQIRSGNSELTKKMIADYKARNSQLEDILKLEREKSDEFTGKMNKVVEGYKVEIAKLQASNDEKDKHNLELKAILQDKNPEVVKVLVEIRDFMKATDIQNKKILGYQTKILEDWQKRSKKIDQATAKHNGDVLRMPTEV